MARRPNYMRRPHQIPEEELTEIIKYILDELERSGRKGRSLDDLSKSRIYNNQPVTFALGLIELKQKSYVYVSRDKNSTRYYLTQKYYQEKK